MAYRVIYGSVEVTERYGGIVASLHGELVEVDGLFVESRGSSRLETTEFETSRP